MKSIFTTAVFLLMFVSAPSHPLDKLVKTIDHGDIQISYYKVCVDGYYRLTTISNGVSQSVQMSVRSDKGMVRTPVPVKCNK